MNWDTQSMMLKKSRASCTVHVHDTNGDASLKKAYQIKQNVART